MLLVKARLTFGFQQENPVRLRLAAKLHPAASSLLFQAVADLAVEIALAVAVQSAAIAGWLQEAVLAVELLTAGLVLLALERPEASVSRL